MKTVISSGAIAMALVFSFGPLWGQDISGLSRVFVFDENKNAAVVIEKPDAQWIKYESLKTGIDSKGLHIATLFMVPSTNIQMAGIKIDKGGSIALHKPPGIYPMYVAAGRGKVTLKNGTSVDIKAGDVFCHMPNTDHGYVNTGDEQLVLLYIRVMPVVK